MPSSPVDNIPDGFDPEKHCGAKTRGSKPCMNTAGFKTDHLTIGRCFLHGGISGTLKHGMRSEVVRQMPSLKEQMEQMKQSPDLLNLDDQIAFLRVLFDRQVDQAGLQFDKFDDVLNGIAELNLDPEDAETFKKSAAEMMPTVDTAIVGELVKIVKVAYEMRFARRFSIPISELAAVVEQIVYAFNQIAQKHGLSQDARVEFAELMQGLKLSRQMDVQLDRAGGMNGGSNNNMREPIEIEARSSNSNRNGNGDHI